jgi:hypothetical protein
MTNFLLGRFGSNLLKRFTSRLSLVILIVSLVSSVGAPGVALAHEQYVDTRSATQLAAAQVQAAAVPNLVAAYSFNENASTTAFDNSGNTNNGTLLNGTAWTAGKNGSAVNFDGTDDFIQIADSNSLDISGSGTFSAWVKLGALNRWHGVVSKGNANDDGRGHNYAIEITNTNDIQCYIGNGTAVNTVTSPTALPLNQFTHVACTWDGSSVKLYINGVLNTSATQTITPAANTSPLYLGQYGGNVDRMLGALDEVRIYNRALTATEIQSDMNTPLEPDTIAPTVSITSPTEGSTVSSTTNVTADAQDNVTISGVEFFVDGLSLGAEDTAAPYSIPWNTLAATNATHTLQAQARDGSGNVTQSTLVTVTVNNPPKLIITAPSQSSTTTGSTVTVTYLTAGDLASYNVDHVHFVLDGGPEMMDIPMDGTYQFQDVPPGTHTLNGFLVRADHTKIAGTDAVPVIFTTTLPDTTAPTVALTAPTASSTVSGTVTLSANASDAVGVGGVQFVVDGVTVGVEDTTAPYSVSWNTLTVTNSNHVITARARDAAGNSATSSPITVTVSNSNLVAAYSFNEGSGTSVNDLSGKGNVGSTASTTWSATGKYGGALSFNGTNSLVNVSDSNSLDLTNGMTLEAWVNPSNVTGWKTFITKENGTNNLAYSLSANNNTSGAANQRPVSRIRIGTVTQTVTGTTKLALNTWTHVASTYDGATLRLYVNGVQVSSLAVTGSMTTTTNLLRIGGSPALGAQYFTGLIDEVRIYNRALTATEIQTDSNTPLQQDTIAPTASITNPLANATSTGSITVTANAADNLTVAGVQFKLDGVNLGAEDTSSPYSVVWDTRTTSNAPHTLIAVARDTSGNTGTSSPIVTNVSNPPYLVITQPINNATINGTTTLNILYSVQGDTTGYDVNHIHFRVDGGPEIMDLPPIDGVFKINNIPAGTHTLDGYLVRVDHSKILGTDAATTNFTIVMPDATAPTVSITAPLASTTVSGTVSVTATSSDNVGVVGVQFLVDGVNIGAEDTTAPYAASWNTVSFASGAHTLSARSRDAAGNIATSSPVSVTVVNNNDPATIGQWTAPFSLPLVALHVAQLNTGKILMWEGQSNGGISARVWDPITGALVAVPNDFINLFCSGQAQLSDGRIMTVGGHSGSPGVKYTSIFDPANQTWTRKTDMNFSRWYPNALPLPDGRVLVTSGSEGCTEPDCAVVESEIYDPITNAWQTLPASADYAMPLYPLNFVLSTGKILNVGGYDNSADTRLLDLTTNTWSIVDPMVLDAQTAVMYAPDKIMKGGQTVDDFTPGDTGPAHARTYVLDMTQPNPHWRQTASMNFPRVYHVYTLLPDGTTLVTGGGRTKDQHDDAGGVLEAEIWNPTTETWSVMAREAIPRLYHGSAILLPDARILVAGSGANVGTNQYSGEIYSPPYLFKGPRPTITSVPANIQHGSQFFVATPDAASISRVTMIRSGTMTHSFNVDQKFVDMTFTVVPGGLMVNAPTNPNNAPGGYYMIFIHSDLGVPSVAKYIRLPSTREDTVPPTAPTNLVANGGLGAATLTWTAATDNITVTNYNVHRSTTSGFTPTLANRIGQPTTTSYQDAGVPSGTYYYKVTAQDFAGNLSPTSNEASAAITSDTSAPTVAITNPVNGATITGSVTLSADASDNVGVVGVQFKIDGVNFGAEDMTTPYSTVWNSTSVANGNHTIAAVARDASGNSTSTSVNIITSNIISTTTLGFAGIGATTDTGDSNSLSVFKFTMPNESGTAQSMSVYIAGSVGSVPNNQYSMAIYADNGGLPGTLVATTANGTITINSWNTLPITANLSPNTTYWLAYNTNGSNSTQNNFRFDTGTTGMYRYRGQTFGTWPASYGTPSGSSNAKASIYVTYMR